MMWSKNTNGNLMIGKGKDGKRAEGRGGQGRGERREERQGIGTDVSQEIWRNERSRGRSWHTKLSGEFPFAPSNSPGFREIVVPSQVEFILWAVSVSQEIPPFSDGPALYSPRDQIDPRRWNRRGCQDNR